MCGVQLNDRKRTKYFMLILGFSEIVDQLAMTSSCYWYCHVLRKDDDILGWTI